jgi:hypothetical protein
VAPTNLTQLSCPSCSARNTLLHSTKPEPHIRILMWPTGVSRTMKSTDTRTIGDLPGSRCVTHLAKITLVRFAYSETVFDFHTCASARAHARTHTHTHTHISCLKVGWNAMSLGMLTATHWVRYKGHCCTVPQLNTYTRTYTDVSSLHQFLLFQPTHTSLPHCSNTAKKNIGLICECAAHGKRT